MLPLRLVSAEDHPRHTETGAWSLHEPPAKVHRTTTERQRSGRVAYVFSQANLPSPRAGLEWRLDPDFNAADEVLAEADLKAVFKLAIDAGCAIVER